MKILSIFYECPGSAVFNITLVIGVCALCARHAITLNWYSLCRDCLCYLVR